MIPASGPLPYLQMGKLDSLTAQEKREVFSTAIRPAKVTKGLQVADNRAESDASTQIEFRKISQVLC